jgi:hypothetical protein
MPHIYFVVSRNIFVILPKRKVVTSNVDNFEIVIICGGMIYFNYI